MSLRNKIILLFVGLAIAPMLTLAAFGYWQAQSFLEATVQDQLLHVTSRTAVGLSATESQIHRQLQELAASAELARLLEGQESAAELRNLLPSPLNRVAFLELQGGVGQERVLLGALPDHAIRTVESGSETLMEFAWDVSESSGGGILRAAYWASELVPVGSLEEDESLVLLDASTGKVLLGLGNGAPLAGGPFADLASPEGGLEPEGVPSRTFKYRVSVSGGWRYGATSLDPQGKWAVTTTSGPGVALTALTRLVRAYWAFVFGLAVATGLAFSLLLGRFTKSLRDLAKATEEIGSGELSPWLPLTASGEVGQLTLAFNRMLGRIREMLDQVDRSGRLAVVGQLSAYFAHEIRNPLSSVKLNLQRLDRWARQGRLPDYCGEPIEISLREVERLSSSVSAVLQLSRAHETPRDIVSVHDQLEETARLVMAKFRGQGVDLTLDLDAGSDLVLARPGQLKSVMLNLMLNALEAQPHGGFLRIHSELTTSRRFGGPAVTVRFRDGGPGVPPEMRRRIFEPFFTTKSDGSGIGLAVAEEAVRDNNGRLYLEAFPSLGSGAEFVLTFPLASIETEAGLAATARRRTAREPVRRNRQPVLVGHPGSFGAHEAPARFMTQEGLEAVMALSFSEPEEVN